MLSIIAVSQMAKADQLADCEQLLTLSDKAISSQAETIDALSQQNKRLSGALDFQVSESARLDSWYRRPEYVIPASLVIGFLGGAYVMRGK